MNPEDIGDDYHCHIHIDQYRVARKAEFRIVIEINFISKRTKTRAATKWLVWRPFSLFRCLDELLRSRNRIMMHSIKFPPLYRRHSIFGQNKASSFLDTRMRELNKYLEMITTSTEVIEFHKMTLKCQSLRSFIAYDGGFGLNPWYDCSMSQKNKIYQKMGLASLTSCQSMNDQMFRWSGTGLKLDSSEHYRNTMTNYNFRYSDVQSLDNLSRCTETSNAPSSEISRHYIIPIEKQRRTMEKRLLENGLEGVGMPPDGSCLLHCLVYELFPLCCMTQYPQEMTVVNCGTADGKAPRRVKAATKLRQDLADYAIENIIAFSLFLMQDEQDLRRRYVRFRDESNEQATITELYAASSMFNLKICLISNDQSFQIDPVLPIPNTQPMRHGKLHTVCFGYLCPRINLPGHYICTQRNLNGKRNTFTGGRYRGSIPISIDRPTSNNGFHELIYGPTA